MYNYVLAPSGVKDLNKNTCKYYLRRFLGYLYVTLLYLLANFYFNTFLEKSMYFLLHIFSLTSKSTYYMLNA
jgi:hypothetical protein